MYIFQNVLPLNLVVIRRLKTHVVHLSRDNVKADGPG